MMLPTPNALHCSPAALSASRLLRSGSLNSARATVLSCAAHTVVPSTARVAEAVDRLPPHLRRLLKDFDWAGVVDLTNAIGTLLMGLLMNHFVEDGHPMVVIRGNQPSIGKSLLAKAIGMVFDGRRVAAIKKSGDGKRRPPSADGKKPPEVTGITYACGGYFKRVRDLVIEDVTAHSIRQTAFHFNHCDAVRIRRLLADELGWSGVSKIGRAHV